MVAFTPDPPPPSPACLFSCLRVSWIKHRGAINPLKQWELSGEEGSMVCVCVCVYSN